MALGVRKYNPGFLRDDEIVESFCVRHSELESLLASLRASTSRSNVHSIVIGPRGSGKTHLLLRAAAEIRREPTLSEFYPVVFAEESYEVSTIGEFWLECLNRLSEQAPKEEQAELRMSRDDLRNRPDDRELANRCLGAALDFAERHEKRLLLVVENLNMLFADMADPDAGWRLRHTLQNEPRIVLIGSATSRFHEIDRPDHALYDLFRVINLRPLDTEECLSLWQAVSGLETQERLVRPLQILTGGNPRLLAIIARLGAGRSLNDLMDNLLELVDDHTEYFKSHLESLPPQERRVYLALATLWKPATTREVADQARMDTNVVSALLKRLADRGAVTMEGGTPRRLQYYLSERLYNIYYLLRRGGGSSEVVMSLLDFMNGLYSPGAVWDAFEEAQKQMHGVRSLRPRLADIFVKGLLDEADRLAKSGHTDEAIEMHGDIIRRLAADDQCPTSGWVPIMLLESMNLLHQCDRVDEAMAVCEDMISRFGDQGGDSCAIAVAGAQIYRAQALLKAGDTSQTIAQIDQAFTRLYGVDTPLTPVVEGILFATKGLALIGDGQPTEAVAALDEVVARFEPLAEWNMAGLVSTALTLKEISLKSAIDEREAAILLECLAETKDLDLGETKVLLQFTVRVGAHKTLEIIEASPAEDLLLPLVTALKQGIGQSTRVAKEVSEVAEDVQKELFKIKLEVAEGTFTAQVPL